MPEIPASRAVTPAGVATCIWKRGTNPRSSALPTSALPTLQFWRSRLGFRPNLSLPNVSPIDDAKHTESPQVFRVLPSDEKSPQAGPERHRPLFVRRASSRQSPLQKPQRPRHARGHRARQGPHLMQVHCFRGIRSPVPVLSLQRARFCDGPCPRLSWTGYPGPRPKDRSFALLLDFRRLPISFA